MVKAELAGLRSAESDPEHASTSSAQIEEQRERCTASLAEFVRNAWTCVERRQLVWGWHIDAVIAHLEAVTHGDIMRLIVNVPPGSSKTLLVQVFWPAWEWICDQHPRVPCPQHEKTQPECANCRRALGFRPDLKYIFATYADTLARDKALICRRLLESQWYQTLFYDRWQRSDEWRATKLGNLQGGWRIATSVGGSATGQHADRTVVDDPIKPQDVLSGTMSANKIALENAWTWKTQTLSTRKTGPEAADVLIMQRIHEKDLAGRLIKEGGYELLCIPQQFERNHPYARATVLKAGHNGTPQRTWKDPRTEEGELMCPERFPLAACEQRKRDLGPQGYAAQEQQRPSPAGGGIYKQAHFKYWQVQPSSGVFVISGDCTFKDASTSDWVALQVWCAQMPNFYLLDQIRDRLDVLGTCEAIAMLRGKWKRVGEILIEDAANGPAVSQIMKKIVPGLRLVTPLGGKVARANASAVYHRSGNVYLPDPTIAPWIRDYVGEHTSFPYGAHDDQVDAQSQAINHLAQGIAEYEKMLETMRAMGIAN